MGELNQYTQLCKEMGKNSISLCGFISSRAIDSSTFIYGDINANFIPKITNNQIIFYRYDESSNAYEIEENETIDLPNSIKNPLKIIHLENKIEEKNVFSLSFAIISEDNGNLRIDIIRKEKSFNLLADIMTSLRKIQSDDLASAKKFKDDIQNITFDCHIGQCSYRFGIPYTENFLIYGGNGTIILYDKVKKNIYRLIHSDGVFKIKNFKLNLKSKTPVFEIVAKGLFTIIDGNVVILVDEKQTRFDLTSYGIETSQIFYQLMKLKEGENANLLLYSNKTDDALLFITDPTEDDFGKVGQFIF
ncbi:MAG: hypothetical protein ABH842_01880 [Candidatus Micrarchaeota archaeon]